MNPDDCIPDDPYGEDPSDWDDDLMEEDLAHAVALAKQAARLVRYVQSSRPTPDLKKCLAEIDAL